MAPSKQAPASPTLSIRLLGDFSLTYQDQAVTGVNTPRLHSLLAYLLFHRDAPQLRQHVAFVFWPDTSEAQARNNLRQVLHQLRYALPDSDRFLQVDARTVGWRSDATFFLDVQEFERALALADSAPRPDDKRAALERAADLYRADLLPSCYDEWIGAERDRLRQGHRRALQCLVDLLEARRDYAQASHHAQRLVREEPLDEEANCRLMRLLALDGDRAGALRVYQNCVAHLQRELGVEPSQATREVYEGLVRRELRPARMADRQPALEATLPLVGRRREWERLHAAWLQAMEGPAGFALITGEAGIGKSRLAEELLSVADGEGFAVARTRSYAAEGQLSLAPAADWLRSDVLRRNLGKLDPVWRTEVSRILPELTSEYPGLPPYEPVTKYGQRQRFFEALARAVLAAPQPLLLLIDDLQWCDQETLEWLHFLLRFDPAAKMLILGTARYEEVPPQHPLCSLVLHLRSTVQVTELRLQPFDAAETARLAAQVAGRDLDMDSAMRLYRETEGNPLFVVETIRSQGEGKSGGEAGGRSRALEPLIPVPGKVQAIISGRLAQLSASARELAYLAAASGRAFTVDLLIEAGHSDEESIVRALEELCQKRIVQEQSPNNYDFSHDKLREIAYTEISGPQRWLLHRRIAQALEVMNADDLSPISGQIAWQYERAAVFDRAIANYQRVAAAAQRLYANEDAVNLLSRGLALLEQLPAGAKRDAQELNLQLALAPLYRMTKGWTSPEVEQALDRAMELCDKVGDDTQRAQLFYGLESLYVVQAKLEKVQLASDELHRLYHRTQARPPLEADIMRIGSRLHLGRIAEANEEFERMLAAANPSQLQRISEEQGWNFAAHGRAWQAHALWLLGYPHSALLRALEGVELANDLGQPFNQALTATYLALLQQLCADESTARASADKALALTTEYKAPYYRAWSSILVCYAQARERPGRATLASLRESIEVFKASGARIRLPYYFGLVAQVCGQAERVEDGLAAVDEAMAASRAHNERWWDAELHRLRGELLLAGGADASEVKAAYLRAIEIARSQQARALELRAAMSLARSSSGQQEAGDAWSLLRNLYSWFTEGMDSPDLQSAGSLLARASAGFGGEPNA
ncbi:MAG TPA: AAA family ATPase [Terriglobia bacterium]|nr:AAA family ATPase [Terriglobia bacterium]